MTNPQKIIQGRYQMVPRTLILLLKGNKVLLQKGAATKKIWAGFYNGLGGHVERGEDVLAAAKRELFEESGLECPDLRLRGILTIEVEEKQGILLFIFSGNEVQGLLQASDEGNLEWMELSQINTLPIVEDIPLLLNMLLVNGPIFYGHYSYNPEGKLITQFSFQR